MYIGDPKTTSHSNHINITILYTYYKHTINCKFHFIPDPDPPTNIVLRQISNKRILATWTPLSARFSGATYRVYINTMNVNNGGTEVTGTTYTTETITNYTVHVRATTGTYLGIPAVSDTLTVRGKNVLV